MKKIEIEIFKHKKTRGYGLTSDEAPTDEDILDKVLEFSKGKNIRIYKHLVEKVWVENKKYPPTIVDDVKIPKGDEIWILAIYYQENPAKK